MSKRRFGGALAVGAGIFLSRIAGLVRERAIAHYLGNSAAAGAFRAALRIPNLLQNLLGEGVLSASFIPVYARLLAEGRDQDASRVARAVGTLLALTASVIALLGVVASGVLVDLLAPGFDDSERALTVAMVRILFPGVALLVMSAWCLGVLNSHRRFFLSYVSPVVWNAAIIVAAIAGAGGDADDVAIWLAWGAVAGSAAQFLVQLPSVWRLLRSLRPSLDVRDPGVRGTLRAFGPVLLGRGSVQLSAYLDQVLASFLGAGIVAAIGYAQILYLLPVSLFGMAISAAELPEMSSVAAEAIRTRLESSLRRVVFLVMPSAVAFVAIGGVIVGLLFETGRFGASDTRTVWIILGGYALGLVASTQGRLLASAFYALGDTRTPLRAALIRVAASFALGWALVLPVRHQLGYGLDWAACGLTASASVGAWIELLLLRHWLAPRIGGVPMPTRLAFATLGAAALAGAAAAGVAWAIGGPSWLVAAAAIPVFGAIYLGVLHAGKVPEAGRLIRQRRF